MINIIISYVVMAVTVFFWVKERIEKIKAKEKEYATTMYNRYLLDDAKIKEKDNHDYRKAVSDRLSEIEKTVKEIAAQHRES